MVETSDLILEDMVGTRRSLAEKIELLENEIVHTVREAKDSVYSTLDGVKSRVEGTVSSVTNAVNPAYQTERHPFAMMALAMGLGAVLGKQCADRANGSSRHFTRYSDEQVASKLYEIDAGWRPGPPAMGAPPRSVLDKVRNQFADEIALVKGMVASAAIAQVGNWIKAAFPQIGHEVDTVGASLKRKVGH